MINATRWWKNGDHPMDHDPIGEGPHSSIALEKYYDYCQTEGKVVRYYRSPFYNDDAICPDCGKRYGDHGWIDQNKDLVVCPGDWVIELDDGTYDVFSDQEMKEKYPENYI